MNISVTPVNDPPVANDDTLTVAEDSIDNLLAVLADNGNGADSDVDGGALSVTAVTAPGSGGTVLVENVTPAPFELKWGRNGGDGTSGTGDGQFITPAGVAVDSSGNVYVADRDNDRIQKFDSSVTLRW